ncbi:MAG: inorganic phosphate transporter [Elusimicrobia bacterium]|nr:inorganic phosphate transporter [Elusimicrobiota bacterium]
MSICFLLLAGIASFYMAWNIGANDSANSMASAVGAKAITFKQAVIIASVLEFLGAWLVGSHVTETIKKGIINPASIEVAKTFAIVLFSAISGASIWVFISTWKGLPVSTTHSIVGALVGAGLVCGGHSIVSWGKVFEIVVSWLTSPFLSGFVAFFLFRFINKFFISTEEKIKIHRTKKYFPFFIFFTFFIVVLSFLFKTPFGKKFGFGLWKSIGISLAISSFATIVVRFFILKKVRIFEPENVFKPMQIITSCYVALAHGANDVANAIGPFAGILSIYRTGEISRRAEISQVILAVGGIGIAIGIFTWGWKVIKTVGNNITELTNTRGFAVDFAAATTVIIASKMGLPVSTTHAAVGAVVGIGFARGIEALDLRVIRNIVFAWILTLPISALISGLIFAFCREVV